MIDLSGACPRWPAGARALWRDCLREAAEPAAGWRELDYQGDPLLREVLGRRYRVPAAHITITAGVRAAALTYARRARLVLLESPGFDGTGYALSGSVPDPPPQPIPPPQPVPPPPPVPPPQPVPPPPPVPPPARPGGRVVRRSWARLLGDEPPAGAVLWLTSPGRNPDGASLSTQDCERLAGWRARGHRIVVDAAYEWFAPRAPRVAGADLLGSLHKLAGRGARLGWVCGETYFAEALPELAGTTPPAPWQRAWGLFAAGGGLELLAGAVALDTAAALDAFDRALRARHGLDLPAADGPNRLLPLAAGMTEPAALAELARRGFALTGGHHFGAPQPSVRATFTAVTPEQAAAFARVVLDRTLFRDPADWRAAGAELAMARPGTRG